VAAAPLAHPPFEEVVIDVVRTPRTAGPRVPVAWLSKAEKAAELQRIQARRAMDAAYEAELILGLAEDTPDDDDPPPGTPGARKHGWTSDGEFPGVSEFFGDELAEILNCGRGTASLRAARAWTYRENLPGTWAALRKGMLDERRATVLAEALEHADPGVARAIEAELLPKASELTIGRLKKLALAALIARDPDAVDRRRKQAEKTADARTYASPLDGMSTLAADLPAEEAAACLAIVDALAKLAKKEGDPRPIGRLRAAMLSALIRQPGDPNRPAVTAVLHVSASLATLAGRSGEVNGTPITAAVLRELLEELGALCPGGLRAPEGGDLVLSLTDDDGRLVASLTKAQLERLVRRGCTDHPDGDCGCPLLDRPSPTDAYEPTDDQRVFVKTRDRTCRFPNCGQRVGWADLDHVVAHSCGGETDCANLCCLCRSHHRLKTFARRWRFVMDPDGTLHVTTPSGVTRISRPPGLRPPPEPPTDADPPPPTGRDDDPPPF
jgi:hypothetical protein